MGEQDNINFASETWQWVLRARSGEYPTCGKYAGQQIGQCLLPRGHSGYCFAEY